MTYTANKWVGLDIGDAAEYYTTEMWNYLIANQWGLWLEGPFNLTFIDNGSGGSNQASVLSYIESTVEPYLSTLNTLGIPVRIDFKGISYNCSGKALSWFSPNFDQVVARYAEWNNGTLGTCVQQFWYETATAPLMQYLHSASSVKTALGYAVNWGNVPPSNLVDIIDIEMWWVIDGTSGQYSTLLNWVKANPQLTVGLDTQSCGNFYSPFTLWGSNWNCSDATPTYQTQQTRCQTACNALMAALGRQFDSLTAEVAGDCGTLPSNICDGNVAEVMISYLNWFLAQNWVATSSPPTPDTTSLTISAPSTATTNTAYNITGVLTDTTTSSPVASASIQLQKNVSSVWTNVDTAATTNSGGTYSITDTETAAGTYQFRTTYAGVSSKAPATSSTASVVVSVPDTTSLTISAPSTGITGTAFNITGVLTDTTTSTALVGTVQLQQYVSSAWQNVKSMTTGSNGAYSFSVSEPSAATYQFRTTYAGTSGKTSATSSTASVVISVPPVDTTSLTISAPSTGTTNTSFNITGVLTDTTTSTHLIATVQLQKMVSSAWTNVTTQTTDSNGAYSFSDTETAAGTYQFRVTYAGSSTVASATSSTVSVVVSAPPSVATQLSMTAPATAKMNTPFSITGTLSTAPGDAEVSDQQVQLQKLVSGTWTNVSGATATTAAFTGSYTISVTETTAGTDTYRVIYLGGTG